MNTEALYLIGVARGAYDITGVPKPPQPHKPSRSRKRSGYYNNNEIEGLYGGNRRGIILSPAMSPLRFRTTRRHTHQIPAGGGCDGALF